MAEWARLESECAGNRTVGSNPTLSAMYQLETLFRIGTWLRQKIRRARSSKNIVCVERPGSESERGGIPLSPPKVNNNLK